MTLEIRQFPCRTDNYGILVRDTASGQVALIDAPDEDAILEAITDTGWTPNVILTTHHHGDHVEANLALKEKFGLTITGPAAEAEKIPGIDVKVGDGDVIRLGSQSIRVISTPGHTAGHVVYHFVEAGVLFAADTLFALGCGRLFERSAAEMHHALSRLAALPDATIVYCGHEYTAANAKFAVTIDPDNPALAKRVTEIDALRAAGKPTLPTTIGLEKATSPFLRWADPSIRRHLGMVDATDAEVFAEIRKRKDNF